MTMLGRFSCASAPVAISGKTDIATPTASAVPSGVCVRLNSIRLCPPRRWLNDVFAFSSARANLYFRVRRLTPKALAANVHSFVKVIRAAAFSQFQRSESRPERQLCVSTALSTDDLLCPLHVCAVRRRRVPVGASPTRQTLQPEATGAV